MRPEGPKIKAEGRKQGGVPGRGSKPHQLGVWGSAVSSPSGIRGGDSGIRGLPKFSLSLFSALRVASPDTIILYYCGMWITKRKRFLNPFNLESITVHLMMLFDVFLVYETKFTVGKWQVVIFTAGKRRGR